MVGPENLPPPGNTYASKVGKKNGRLKLNDLDIYLDRREPSISYNLTKEELAKLLFKKMAIDPKNIIKLDTSGFGKINLELSGNVNPESFINFPSFDIREGLRTKFYRPHHRKDTLITISWLDLETPDNLVTHVFSHFGTVKSNVQWTKIKQEEDESPVAKMLNNILSGERQIWMEVNEPIPSYAIIDGRKVKIFHPGQRRTCARCQKTADHCPGKSNAKLCEEKTGEKVKLETAWNATLAKVGYSEWIGGEIVTIEDTKVEDEVENNDNKAKFQANFPNCDGIILSNLPDDITNTEIEKILDSVVLNSSDGISILQEGSTRSRLVQNIALADISEMVRKIEHKSIRGNIIHCRPHVPATPPPKESIVAENSVGKVVSKADSSKIYEKVQVAYQIPGLSEKEMQKALKVLRKNFRKVLKRKERKRKKKNNLT